MNIASPLRRFAFALDKILPPSPRTRIPVLAYHSISPLPFGLCISPDAFARQMDFLADQGYRTIDNDQLREMVEGRCHLVDRPIVLTFDDGYCDFLEFAVPILKRHLFTATVFIAPELVGSHIRWGHEPPTFALLGWPDLRTVLQEGFFIGSHSSSHTLLSHLGNEVLDYEINRSREVLETTLGCAICTFCPPYGILGRRARQLLRAQSDVLVYGGMEGHLPVSHPPWLLPRISINRDLTLNDFRTLVGSENPIFFWMRNVRDLVSKDLPSLIGLWHPRAPVILSDWEVAELRNHAGIAD